MSVRVVSKHVIEYPYSEVLLPADAEIIGLGEQFGALHLFVIGSLDRSRQFTVIGVATGEKLPRDDLFHVGSLFVSTARTEWHFFVPTSELFQESE